VSLQCRRVQCVDRSQRFRGVGSAAQR
jgi:hypothetical protein